MNAELSKIKMHRGQERCIAVSWTWNQIAQCELLLRKLFPYLAGQSGMPSLFVGTATEDVRVCSRAEVWWQHECGLLEWQHMKLKVADMIGSHRWSG